MFSGPLIFSDSTAPDQDWETMISFLVVADSRITEAFLESPVSLAVTVIVTLPSPSVAVIQDGSDTVELHCDGQATEIVACPPSIGKATLS